MRPQCLSRFVRAAGFFLGTFLLIQGVEVAAQPQVPYPSPRIATISPPGAKAGTTVEITVTGSDLDDATALYFSDPKIKAERLPDPPPPKDKKKDNKKAPPPPPRFRVTVPADSPPAIHDVRLIGEWGISNPRAFVVGDLTEAMEKEPNSDVPEAQRIEIDRVINGAIGSRTDVDYFIFEGKKGQNIVLHCAASSIDSQLLAYVQLYDANGQQHGSNKHYRDRDAVLSHALPADGDYLVRVSDFAYQVGGPEAFYRLSISTRPWIDAVFPPLIPAGKASQVTLYGRNLPGDEPAAGHGTNGPAQEELTVSITPPPPQPGGAMEFRGRLLPRAGAIEGFGYRHEHSNPVLLGYASEPIVLDQPGNESPEEAQPIEIGTDICGRIEKKGDRDYFAFTAKKDDVVIIEGIADRLRCPVDLYLTVRRAENKQMLGEFDDNPAVPDRVNRFYTYSDDPLARVVIPADGRYELMVTSRDSLVNSGPRQIYAVRVRKEQPDFQLVVVGNHESGAGLCVRRGSNHDIQVVCFRQDGLEEPITLTAEGLPAGVTCQPQVIGPKLAECVLVLTANSSAKDWTGEVKVKGSTTVGGKKIERLARAGCLVYPSQNNNIPAVSRLSRSICLAVRDPGPFRLTTSAKEIAVPVGGSASVKLKVNKQIKDFKNNVAITLAAGPPQQNGRLINTPNINIAPDKEGEVKFQIPNNAPAGVYNLVFRGLGQMPMEDPVTKRRTNAQFFAVSTPIELTVFDSACDLVLKPASLAVRPGSETDLAIELKRLYDFKGEVTLELVAPQGASGIGAATVKVPANATQAKLVLKVDKNVKPAKDLAYQVRATARVGNSTLRTEEKISISIGTQVPPPPPGEKIKAANLLPQGADGWKYAAKVAGDDWIKPDFNDKSWKELTAPFGYGEPEIAKRKGKEIGEKSEPVFARRTFDVPSDLLKEKGVVFRLQVASDNSAVVYLNGKLLDEDNDNHEFSYWNREVTIPADRLKAGRNVIAVRVNNNSGSTDLYLDLAVTAQVPEGDGKK